MCQTVQNSLLWTCSHTHISHSEIVTLEQKQSMQVSRSLKEPHCCSRLNYYGAQAGPCTMGMQRQSASLCMIAASSRNQKVRYVVKDAKLRACCLLLTVCTVHSPNGCYQNQWSNGPTVLRMVFWSDTSHEAMGHI